MLSAARFEFIAEHSDAIIHSIIRFSSQLKSVSLINNIHMSFMKRFYTQKVSPRIHLLKLSGHTMTLKIPISILSLHRFEFIVKHSLTSVYFHDKVCAELVSSTKKN